ncbi:CBS domain-containing protein [Amycolatopsis sp. NBC_01286]|uniref:CBS domain-containing protein n=1 Tax=Amycolatopsis sp. NBC_01286 TaxID=2903560 RepID=UPI002E15DD67|nr:CBS domain-containing protein [Amycolatopsis sp. NBC_01286]
MRTSTTAGQVMTRDVLTATPAAPFKDLVAVIVTGGVSAVPVVSPEGGLLGVVTEADLLCRQAHQDDRLGAACPHFAGHLTREDWRKAAARTAATLMTAATPTTTPGATLPEVARLLTTSGVRRLFVLDGERLVGVVARRDVLRTFLRTDEDLRDDVDRTVLGDALHADRNAVLASVERGVVLLTGRLEYEADVATAERLALAVPGVVEVRNRMDFVWQGGRAVPRC